MKGITTIIFALVVVMCFSACSRIESSAERITLDPVQYPSSSMEELRDIDYSVYKVIIEKEAGNKTNVARISRPHIVNERVRNLYSGFNSDVIDNFNAKSQLGISFEPKFPIEKELTLFDEVEADPAANSEKDLAKMFEHYPYFRFSRIGFSKDEKEALVYADYMCGLCGDGSFYWLRNVDGKWEIVRTDETWVS